MDSRFRGNDEGDKGMVRWENHDFSSSPYPELGLGEKKSTLERLTAIIPWDNFRPLL